MRILAFLLLFPFNSIAQDALLEAIYGNWNKLEKYEKEDESNYEEIPDSSEAEVYHWSLGTPDNLPETIIIYESSPCE